MSVPNWHWSITDASSHLHYVTAALVEYPNNFHFRKNSPTYILSCPEKGSKMGSEKLTQNWLKWPYYLIQGGCTFDLAAARGSTIKPFWPQTNWAIFRQSLSEMLKPTHSEHHQFSTSIKITYTHTHGPRESANTVWDMGLTYYYAMPTIRVYLSG